MNDRIKNVFSHKAFIAFLTAGDPDLETSERCILSLLDNGADAIEIGIPFSDPMAEGPTIQKANQRALKNNVRTDDVFELLGRIRCKTDKALLFMTYANIVYAYGIERFAEKAEEYGLDGIILPDVPFEESSRFKSSFRKNGIDFISMIAPTSEDRIRTIAEKADGFIYLVSSLGVTGIRSEIRTDIESIAGLIRKANPDIPIAVGFGISTETQAKTICRYSDGIIIGSAIVKKCEEYGKNAPSELKDYAIRIRGAIGK